jgi:hypothetical protein
MNENIKEELQNNIKEWLKIDSEIAKMKSEMKEKAKNKKELSELIIDIMKTNSLDCLNMNDGSSIMHTKKRTPKTISAKYLLSQLKEHYKDNEEMAIELKNKILQNRNKTEIDIIVKK